MFSEEKLGGKKLTEQKIVDRLLKYRYLLSLLSVLVVGLLSVGAKNLYVESDYSIYFRADNPQLKAFEHIQNSYTKSDNLGILIQPNQGDLFTAENLQLIKQVTDEAWDTPYSIRVDSISNFQNSWASGDELIVEDLVENISALDVSEIARIKSVALSERQLVNKLISRDGKTTLVNISLELPPIPDKSADAATQAQQRALRDGSNPKIVEFGRKIRADILAQYPSYQVHLVGIPVINDTFHSSSMRDAGTLIPLMYLVILVTLFLCLRSVGGVIAATVLITLATMAGMGSGGWLGLPLNSISIVSPIIILTIAICDSVHLLVIYQRHLALGDKPMQAMRESLLVNLQPIALTSVTTAVGFLTLNFSDSPPFGQLGNMSALGILFAMVLSLTLMPTLSMWLIRRQKPNTQHNQFVERFSGFVIRHGKWLFPATLFLALLFIAQIPRNQIDDDPIRYFDEGIAYRDAAEFSKATLPGIKSIEFSVSCDTPSCIHQPSYLQKLDAFGQWLEQQNNVEAINTYVDVIKRLNRNMHGDDEAYFSLPETPELAAQYHLLYELSLPYGLDLLNLSNFDKSATRVTVLIRQTTTGELVALNENAQQWFDANYPQTQGQGASVDMIFAYIGERNVRSMSGGALVALLGVTLTILLALRSFKYGFISMIPNAFPCAIALGIWGLSVAQVNMAVAVVFSITLGIVVDNTVHFISKYRRARNDKGFSPEQSIHYAFSMVGVALVVTAAVLAIGFGLLNFSSFNLNGHMGGVTAITIVVAVIFDFLILPPLLLLVDCNTSVQYQGSR